MSVSIRDNDGEFILIEAACVLPKWMKPATTQNRVFIRGGQVTVIPIAESPAELDTLPYKMDVASALALMRSGGQYCRPSVEITAAMRKRLDRFATGKYKKDQHHVASVRVPEEVAYLLCCYPQMISNAVGVFCDRDPDDMASLVAMKRFPFDSERLVDCKLRFTRCLYAQVKQQRFNQPRQFKALPKPSSPDYPKASLGVKIHCAMEMLYNRKEGHMAWQSHLNKLKKSNYFGDEIKGSKLYKEKLDKARKDWDTQQQHGSSGRDRLSSLIDQCLRDPSLSRDSMNRFINETSDALQETSDKWMDKIPSRYEDLLTELENKDKSSSMDVNNITKSFQKMLNATSSFEGIDFAGGSGESNFNADKFMSILKGVVGIPNENDNAMDEQDDDEDLYKDIADYDFGDSDEDEYNEEDEDEDEDEDEQDQSFEFDYDNIHMSNLKNNRKESIGKYMRQMDFELSKTTIAQSFEKVQMEGDELKDSEQLEKESINRPVNLNFNLVKNIIGSLSSQQGLAGPASTILKEFIESNGNKK